MDNGLWTMDYGLWTMDYRLSTIKHTKNTPYDKELFQNGVPQSYPEQNVFFYQYRWPVHRYQCGIGDLFDRTI
jgi:hypothetical protein